MNDVNCKGIKLHFWSEISPFFNNDVALKLEFHSFLSFMDSKLF